MNNSPARLRVLVAEDNDDLRAAICALVGAEPDMEVAADTAVASEIVPRACSHDVQVVVLDLNLRGQSSVAAMQSLQQQRPQVAAVIYSGYDESEIKTGLHALAPCAYVPKCSDGTELIEAIRRLGNDAASAR